MWRATDRRRRAVFAAAAILSAACGGMANSWPDAYGQDESGPDAAPAEPFRIHVPDMMIAGVQYEGVVVFENPAGHDRQVSLAVSDGGVRTPGEVAIPAGRNHGIFGISAGADIEGSVSVHAAALGHVSTVSSVVHAAPQSKAGLAIYGPTATEDVTTQTHRIPLYVFVLDEDGEAVRAENDVRVLLVSSTPSVKFEDGRTLSDEARLTIPGGGHSAYVIADVRGDGIVYAVSDGLEGDSIGIEYAAERPALRMAVSPEVVAANSYAYYYVWMESDGKQYVPPELTKVAMSSGNTTVAAFEGAPSAFGADHHADYMIGGTARGIMRAGSPGTAVLTASVPHVGTAESYLTVAPAAPAASHGTPLSASDTNLVLTVHPDGAAGRAWGVVSAYGALSGTAGPDPRADLLDGLVGLLNATGNLTGNLTGNDIALLGALANLEADPPAADGPPLGHDEILDVLRSYHFGGYDGALAPVPFPRHAEIILAGSDGIIHEGTVRPAERVTGARGSSSVTAFEFAIDAAAPGDHWIEVHQPNMAGADAAFETTGGAVRLEVARFPVQRGVHADLAMMFLVAGGNAVADLPGGGVAVRPMSAGITLDDPARIADSAVILSGRLAEEGAGILASMSGQASTHFLSSMAGTAGGISVWAPDRVHTAEPFPVAVHRTDADGNPVGLTTEPDVASSMVAADGNEWRMLAAGQTDVTVISGDDFLDTVRIVSFANDASIDVGLSTDGAGGPRRSSPEDILAGDNVSIYVAAESFFEPIVRIAAEGLEFVAAGFGEYVAVPAEPGEYEVVVTVEGAGFVPVEQTVSFTAGEAPARISYAILTDDSFPANMPVEIRRADGERAAYRIQDGASVLAPPGLYSVAVPERMNFGDDRTYTLRSVLVDGEYVEFSANFTLPIFADTAILSEYAREITVEFWSDMDSDLESVLRHSSTSGSGSYRYGDPVLLEAPILYEYGVVRHVPYEWAGLPDGASLSPDLTAAFFNATESASGTVSYSRDYTILYGLAAAAAAGIPVAARARSPHVFGDLRDMIGSLPRRLKRNG